MLDMLKAHIFELIWYIIVFEHVFLLRGVNISSWLLLEKNAGELQDVGDNEVA